MINIINTPSSLGLVSNPLAFVVEGDSYIVEAGSQPYIVFQWVAGMVETSVFQFPFPIDISGAGLDIYFMSAISNAQIYSWGLTIFGTVDQHISDFKKNFIIDKNYIVSKVDTDKIKFLYRDTKPENILPANIIPSFNYYSINDYDEGTEREVIADFKIIAKLYLEEVWDSGEYSSFDFVFDVDETGQAEVQFNEFVKSYFIDRDLPAFNQLNIVFCEHLVKRYYFKFCEYSGESGSYGPLKQSSDYRLINARLSFVDFADTNFVSWLISFKNYLSYQNIIVYTRLQTPQYLYYFHSKRDDNVYIKYTVFFDDYTNSSVNSSDIAIENYQCAIIPVGYSIVADLVTIPADGKIYKYEVSVYDSNDVIIAKKMTYFVEENQHDQVDFLFENSFSVFETLICTGNLEKNLSVENKLYQKHLKRDYNALDGQYISNPGIAFNTFTCHTGFKEKSEIDNIENLLNAKDFYMVDYDNSRYIPCRLLSSEIEISNSKENLYSLRFEYRYAYDI